MSSARGEAAAVSEAVRLFFLMRRGTARFASADAMFAELEEAGSP